VVAVATVREKDGLALSSRNKHLTPVEREIAPVLSRALRNAIHAIERGERQVAPVRDAALAMFAQHPEVRVEYFEFSDPDTLQTVERIEESVLVAGALWLASTRLIDNMRWP
jgi:pantoate--beta-alanine ligase